MTMLLGSATKELVSIFSKFCPASVRPPSTNAVWLLAQSFAPVHVSTRCHQSSFSGPKIICSSLSIPSRKWISSPHTTLTAYFCHRQTYVEVILKKAVALPSSSPIFGPFNHLSSSPTHLPAPTSYRRSPHRYLRPLPLPSWKGCRQRKSEYLCNLR